MDMQNQAIPPTPGAAGMPAKKVFSRIGLGLMLMMLVSQIVAGIAVAAAPSLLSTSWFLWVVNDGALYLAGFLVFLLVIRGVPGGPKLGSAPGVWRPSAGQMVMLTLGSIGVAQLLNLLSSGLMTLVGSLLGDEVANPLLTMIQGSGAWWSFIALVIVAPIMEEQLFRRILYNKLSPYGGKVYVLFSGLVFALFHVNFYQLPYAFVLGVMFAVVTWYTNNIRYATLLHLFVNLLGSGVGILLMAYASETVLGIWSVAILALAAVGLIVCIIKRKVAREAFRGLEPGALAVSSKEALGNLGMVLYYIFAAGIMLINIFAGPISRALQGFAM